MSDRIWTEKDNVISFTVTSDGTTGPQWVKRLEAKGDRVSDFAKGILWSKYFKPTTCVTTEIRVLKGELFTKEDRITKNIRAEATCRNFVKPNAVVGCLIRDLFSDTEIEAMGLWCIVAMHDPIQLPSCCPDLLAASRGVGGRWLSSCGGHPGRRWNRNDGFAFALSQVS